MLAVSIFAGLLPAMAGPAQDIAEQFSAAGRLPTMAVACAPLRESLSAAGAMDSLTRGAQRPEIEALVAAMQAPETENQHAIDLDGGFLSISAGDTTIMQLPLHGGLNDAIAVFTSPDQPEWTIDGDRAVRIESDGKRSVLTVQEGVARIRTGPEAASGKVVKVPESLAKLPDAPGCAMWTHGGDMPSGSERPAFLRFPITFWMPFEDGEPAELRVQLPAHRDRAEHPTVTSPLRVSSPARPSAVFTLGVPPFSILQDPIVQAALPEAARRQLDVGGSLGDVGAGAVGAVFPGSQHRIFVVAVPVHGSRGRAVSRRRIQKEIDRALNGAMRSQLTIRARVVDRFTTEFLLPNGMTLTLRAGRGAVYLGNDPSYVLSTAEGLGEPWLDDAGMEWAASHAITMSGEAPLPGLTKPIQLRLGAGTEGNVLLVQLSMEPGLRDPRVAEAFRMMKKARMPREPTPSL